MKGILFKDEMVRPILNTKPDVWPAKPIDASKPFKWQTRRAAIPKGMTFQLTPTNIMATADGRFVVEKWPKQPREFGNFGRCFDIKPKYNVGEIIYVKEVWAPKSLEHPKVRICYRSDMSSWGNADCHDLSNNEVTPDQKILGDKIPVAPKHGWKSSLIMPAYAARLWVKVMNVRVERVNEMSAIDVPAEGLSIACQRPEYASLYNRINGSGSFDRDWCFVYEFKRVSKP